MLIGLHLSFSGSALISRFDSLKKFQVRKSLAKEEFLAEVGCLQEKHQFPLTDPQDEK